jgi:hypothetical protein
MSADKDEGHRIELHFGSQRLADAFKEVQEWMANADPKFLAELEALTMKNMRPYIPNRRPPKTP